MAANATATDANAPVRLRVEIFDALAAAKGARTEMERAWLIGTHLTTLYRLRHAQHVPRLDLAMRMAARLGVAVDDIFELVEDEPYPGPTRPQPTHPQPTHPEPSKPKPAPKPPRRAKDEQVA